VCGIDHCGSKQKEFSQVFPQYHQKLVIPPIGKDYTEVALTVFSEYFTCIYLFIYSFPLHVAAMHKTHISVYKNYELHSDINVVSYLMNLGDMTENESRSVPHPDINLN
jgi:hypothetical protein